VETNNIFGILVKCLNILLEFRTIIKLADSVTMYAIATASFVVLLLILHSSRASRQRKQTPPLISSKNYRKIDASRRKNFKALKQIFMNENSIFDERNKDGLSGYSP
jgi:hypothetical protein